MTQLEAENETKGTPRRFYVELFIVHPTLEPAQITATLGLKPKIAHKVGDERKTPAGAQLAGVYRDTGWRYSVRYEVTDQWFAEKVTELVDRLMPHKEYFRQLRSTGGRASIIVDFVDEEYFSDEIPRNTLAKLVDLELDLGIGS